MNILFACLLDFIEDVWEGGGCICLVAGLLFAAIIVLAFLATGGR